MVLEHIKQNFINSIGSHSNDKNNYENFSDDFWTKINFENRKISKKLLLHFNIENIAISYQNSDVSFQNIKINLKYLKCVDMHHLNRHYRNLIEIKNDIKLILSSKITKLVKKIIKKNCFCIKKNL